jgi:hypothetical protein
MFAVFVQDVSEYAVALHGQASATDAQRAGALTLVRAPSAPAELAAAMHREIVAYGE